MNYHRFISNKTRFDRLSEPFNLESGKELFDVRVAYRTWGQLNKNRDNAILVCHAFTGWADLELWWQPLLGSGKVLDPDRHFIICSNILGSCYGTTGPTSIDPKTGVPYGPTFPAITVRDMVHLQARLLEALGISSLQLVIGGSLGGMQVLEWALLYPNKVRAIAPIAVSGRHSAWCIGWSEAQRQAIYADPNWQGGYYQDKQKPDRGLAVARAIAMSTYRSRSSFSDRFGRQHQGDLTQKQFAIANYLQYQGKKLVKRFDANTYITLSQAMDSHDVTRPDRNYESVLKSIQQPTSIVGITSDILYPPVEQEELASLIPNSRLMWLNSSHGHDGFLIDLDELNALLISYPTLV